ncbi:type I restriction enzyme R protein [Mycoplasmopsis canis UFG4]|uniref:Type I restriction enzyme R protein n=1 Tax=Mycoplasmopsis canis UFG4 TaxID=1131455 RepID=I1A5V2_9BACT|nr:type I restriction enzyme R protein [Mycoplasmopsis canis UFG4]
MRENKHYKDLKYGYVIDFVDIKENFDETNEKYLNELKRFNTGLSDESFKLFFYAKRTYRNTLTEQKMPYFQYTMVI